MTRAEESELGARFERLLAEHGGGLRRVGRSYTRSPAEAADLVQDIALALWRALPSFRGECSERAFVFRVAHNRGLSYVEARRVRGATQPLEDAGAVPDGLPPPDEQLDAARRRAALLAAIGALPVGHRVVLTLALEGLSHEEIAQVVGIGVGNVGVRLSRARAALRTQLGGGT